MECDGEVIVIEGEVIVWSECCAGVLVEGTGYTKEYAEAHDDKMCLR